MQLLINLINVPHSVAYIVLVVTVLDRKYINYIKVLNNAYLEH